MYKRYFLAVYRYKRMRLIPRVYGNSDREEIPALTIAVAMARQSRRL